MPKSFSTSLLLLLSVFIFITSCIAEQRKLNENVHDTSSHCDEDGNSTSTLSTDHKSLFPMNGYDVGSTILVFVGSSFANAGGAGGGGIFVPLLILLAQFSPHGAIPLSKAMIFGGALTFVSITFRKRHPEADKPLIDYDIALMFEPMVLCGTTVGVLLNRVFPSWMLLTCLEILLVTTVYRTFKKGIKKYKEESNQTRRSSASRVERQNSPKLIRNDVMATNDDNSIEMARLSPSLSLHVSSTSHTNTQVAVDVVSGTESSEETKKKKHKPLDRMISHEFSSVASKRKENSSSELRDILHREARTVPLNKIALISFVWIFIMILALMRGGHGASSIVGIENCSVGYWFLTFSVFPVCIAVTLWVGRDLRYLHQRKLDLGYEYLPGMVQWNQKNSIVYPMCCFFAGCAAGLLGIGGGLVLGPMLLEMNVRPQVSAATSSLMVLFTASCTSIQFAILGQLDMEYAAWFGSFTSLGAVIGVFAVQYAVQRLGRPSVIVLSLATVILLSAILIPSFAIPDLISDIDEQGTDALSFHEFCGCSGQLNQS